MFSQLLRGKGLPGVFDLRRPTRTGVQEHAPAKLERLAGRELEVPAAGPLVLEVVHAEGVGREQPVGARVPPGRMAWVLGMIEATYAAAKCIRDGVDEASYIAPFLEPYLPYYDSIREEPEFVELLAEIDAAAKNP